MVTRDAVLQTLTSLWFIVGLFTCLGSSRTLPLCTFPHMLTLNSWSLFAQSARSAFKSGDSEAYRTPKANLNKCIKPAKLNYTTIIEDFFSNNADPQHIWQGIQAITIYKSSNSCPLRPQSLPSELKFLCLVGHGLFGVRS